MQLITQTIAKFVDNNSYVWHLTLKGRVCRYTINGVVTRYISPKMRASIERRNKLRNLRIRRFNETLEQRNARFREYFLFKNGPDFDVENAMLTAHPYDPAKTLMQFKPLDVIKPKKSKLLCARCQIGFKWKKYSYCKMCLPDIRREGRKKHGHNKIQQS